MHFSQFFTHCPACGSANFQLNNVKSKRCSACGYTHYVNASAAVAAFITNEHGQLLVCRRAKDPAKGTLDLPGGFVDDNETAEEALLREIQEELNAKICEANYLFSLPNEYEYSGLTIPTLDLFFSCRIEYPDQLIAGDDVEACEFMNPNEIHPEAFGLKSIRKAVALFLDSLNKKEA